MLNSSLCKSVFGLATLVLLTGAAMAQKAAVEDNPPGKAPVIQMAILLDNSGSMSGLIDQARTQLWSIVNEFATTERNGLRPELKVALFQYGVTPQMVLPLTNDLDRVSEKLFALTIAGGTECCGQVIQGSLEQLDWSKDNNDYKVIFIAGNEPFTQGAVNYTEACKGAITKGIIVNTIHCGAYETGVAQKWADGAKIAEGSYMHIDHNRQAIHIAAPQDLEIARLGTALNGTYIPYGTRGAAGRANQLAQDSNAKVTSGTANVSRMISKASFFYSNSSWDLVDALKDGKVELEKLKEKDLPENMQKMSQAERKEFIEAQGVKRGEIQGEINKLNEARKKHVEEEMKKRTDKGENTLEAVMLKSVRAQMSKKNFKIKK